MRIVVLSVILAACASTDASSLPAEVALVPPPPPTLVVPPLVPGDLVTIRVRGVAPGDEVVVGLSGRVRAGAACPPVLGGSCLDLVSPTALGRAAADAEGEAQIEVVVPAGAAVGNSFFLQAGRVGGGVNTSVVRGTISEYLPIFGTWDDAFGSAHEIDHQVWDQGYGLFHITRWSASQRAVIARNDAANSWAAGLWSRFDWTEQNGRTFYCQTAYDAPTEAAAISTPAADPTSPETSGCGPFAWTELLAAGTELDGSWMDAYGGSHMIDASLWDMGYGLFHIERFSNFDNVIIAHNDASNGYAPGLWSRFDWTEYQGSTWYCQTAYDAPTAWDARQTAAADPTTPDLSGCGAFPWTAFVP